MIHVTSVPYVIETYDVVVTSLYADGTPKAGTSKHSKSVKQFPQEVIDRVHGLTENRRFRRFVRGMPLTGIDLSWLFICFERSVPHRVVSSIRDTSGLDSEQWGFYTFDEDRLKELRSGGNPPDVNVFAFSDMPSASKAFSFIGAPPLVEEMKMRAELCYFLFAEHEVVISERLS